MKLSIKDYKIEKTKKWLKTSNFFFFVNGVNRNSLDWIFTEQGLKTIGFCCFKILNKTTVKTLNASIFSKISSTIKGSTFFIKQVESKQFLKRSIVNTFNPLFFELLIFKFNNQIYSASSLKNIYTLNYQETKLLFYQFNLSHTKTCYTLSK
jgi:hypothetical protein